jgi:hypothetical protein
MDGLPDRVPVQFEFCAQLYDHCSKKLGIPMHCTMLPNVCNWLTRAFSITAHCGAMNLLTVRHNGA